MTEKIRNEEEIVSVQTVTALGEEVLVAETTSTEPKKEKKSRTGVVVGCTRLNVRKKPTKAGEVLCIIDKDTEVEIDDNRPESKWVRVIINDVVGFCMREYIQEL